MGKGFWTTVREFLGTEEQYQRMHGAKQSTGTDGENVYYKDERLIGGDDKNHIHDGVTQTFHPTGKWESQARAEEFSHVKGTYDSRWEGGRGERSDRGREDR